MQHAPLLHFDAPRARDENGPLPCLHLHAGGGFAFCGWHAMQAGKLEPIRRPVPDPAVAFDELLNALDRPPLTLHRANSLTSMPRGSEEEEEHRRADAIRLGTPGTRLALPTAPRTSGGVVDQVEDPARHRMPLLAFPRRPHAR